MEINAVELLDLWWCEGTEKFFFNMINIQKLPRLVTRQNAQDASGHESGYVENIGNYSKNNPVRCSPVFSDRSSEATLKR